MEEKWKPLRKIIMATLLVAVVVSATSAVSLWWYTQYVPFLPPPHVRYETYSKYGFSFQYPKGMTISEQGLLESTATNVSGMAFGELKNEKHELITVGWLKTVTAPDLEAGLEGGFTSMAEAEGVTSVEKGELVETTKAGHRMIYHFYTVTIGGEKFYGISGNWYCDTNERLYHLNLMYSEEDTLPIYQRYLDSFVCH